MRHQRDSSAREGLPGAFNIARPNGAMARRPPKPEQQALARERVRLLFAQAEQALRKGRQAWPLPSGAALAASDPRSERAAALVALARRVAERSAVKIPAPWNRRFCRRCSALLGPGTSRVRTSAKQRAVVVTCLRCGAVRRRPYRREQAARSA